MAKEKIKLEYILKNASLNILWTALSTSSGLEEWFADKVTTKDKLFTFTWSGNEQQADLISMRQNSNIRFHWLDDDDEKSYFEFKIAIDEITNAVILSVTDFADAEDIDDTKNLWESQINDLKRKFGL